jgi:hypothetical protein
LSKLCWRPVTAAPKKLRSRQHIASKGLGRVLQCAQGLYAADSGHYTIFYVTWRGGWRRVAASILYSESRELIGVRVIHLDTRRPRSMFVLLLPCVPSYYPFATSALPKLPNSTLASYSSRKQHDGIQHPQRVRSRVPCSGSNCWWQHCKLCADHSQGKPYFRNA